MKMRKHHCRFALLSALALATLLLAACAQATATAAPPPAAPVAAAPTHTPAPPTATPEPPPPTATATPLPPTVTPPPPTATPEPPRAPAAGLRAEPQVLVFQAADGEPNEGVFFPAAQPGAPVVVLMHWAPGFACDWAAIAPWLQNRGVTWDCPTNMSGPWLQSQWFPSLPAEASYNVFVFSFRGCGEDGCAKFDPFGWQADAFGAMAAVGGLAGIDLERVIAIGASIGADGAIDGCAFLNDQQGAVCRGAVSLSPGSYLDLPYQDMVGALEEDGYPAWCLYAPEDAKAVETCESASGEDYELLAYPNGGHGMVLIQPGFDTLQKLLDFIALTVG